MKRGQSKSKCFCGRNLERKVSENFVFVMKVCPTCSRRKEQCICREVDFLEVKS